MFIEGRYKIFKDVFYSLVFFEVVYPVSSMVLNEKGGYLMAAVKPLYYILVGSPNSDLLGGILYNSSWNAVCFLRTCRSCQQLLLFRRDDSSMELRLLELERSW